MAPVLHRGSPAMRGCKHTPCPKGYLGWHSWAEKKSKTHQQTRCPNCGLYAVWVKRPGASS